MPIPNGGLITETNEQYYAGAQRFFVDDPAVVGSITTTFNTDLIFGNDNPALPEYSLNNFKLYSSATGLAGSYTEYTGRYSVIDNTITFIQPEHRSMD